MNDFEVPEPIICTPFEEPACHWHLAEGQEPDKRDGRRPATYYFPAPTSQQPETGGATGTAIELKLVNLIRTRVKQWRAEGYPGVTATTLELLDYWRRDGRGFRFFFAQLEAVETVMFLNEARRDFSAGHLDSDRRPERKAAGGTRLQGIHPLRLQDGDGVG